MPKKSKELPLHRIIIVGCGGVGKSALTFQFMYGNFIEEYDPTAADSYRKQVKLDGDEMLVDILDTAGQEEYSAMRDNYYRTGEGFLCVYAITMPDSFSKVKEFREQICRVLDNDEVPMVVAANKSDLEKDRQVSKAEGEQLAKDFGAPFFETSAKTNQNVEQAFMTLTKMVKDGKLSSAKSGKKKRDCVIQ